MFVCVCAAVTEDEVVAAVENGNDTHEKLVDNLGVCSYCCMCKDDINKKLNDYGV